MKVAIVHDWLVGGGAERVIYELRKIYPDAPIYTSYCTDEWRAKLDSKVVTGYLQHWPFSICRKFLPVLRMWWFSKLDLSDYDLVISSSGNGEAKHIRAGRRFHKGQTHVNYCHSPVHFYWRHYQNYMHNPGFGVFNSLARLGLRLLVHPLRQADYRAAQNVDYFIANSTHIRNDIQSYYDRESTVIFPPVNVDRFSSNTVRERHGFITVGRMVPNKRPDIIVAACTKLGLPLKVVGPKGPELERLKKLAGPSVKIITNASDEEVVQYMASAEAFLFASFEDFGITPVEALAAGTPVIAYHAGGALDYVNELNGLFFNEQTVNSLVTALQSFNSANYSSDDIKNSAKKFSSENFQKNMQEFINSVIQ